MLLTWLSSFPQTQSPFPSFFSFFQSIPIRFLFFTSPVISTLLNSVVNYHSSLSWSFNTVDYAIFLKILSAQDTTYLSIPFHLCPFLPISSACMFGVPQSFKPLGLSILSILIDLGFKYILMLRSPKCTSLPWASPWTLNPYISNCLPDLSIWISNWHC